MSPFEISEGHPDHLLTFSKRPHAAPVSSATQGTCAAIKQKGARRQGGVMGSSLSPAFSSAVLRLSKVTSK